MIKNSNKDLLLILNQASKESINEKNDIIWGNISKFSLVGLDKIICEESRFRFLKLISSSLDKVC